MNPVSLTLNTLAQIVSGQIGSCLAVGTVILLFAGLSARLLQRESSGIRFAVWFAALVAMGGIPLFAIAWSLGSGHGGAGVNGNAEITLPSSWALYLFSAWSVVAGAALARIVAGFCQVCALRRRSAVVDTATLPPELQETLTRFRPSRDVAILLSDEIQSPTAIGLLSPAIVLPTWLTNELSTGELRQILLHELAHLRRWDDWSNLLQKIVKALFFFHPAVWWMEKQISLEREMACDEAVLAHTDNPRAYAQCLVLLAEKSFFRRSMMLAQAAVSRVAQTSLRVARILSGGPPRTTGMWKLITPSFAALLIVCLASLDHMPALIAFESKEPAFVRVQAAPQQLPGVVEASIVSSAGRNVAGKQRSGSSFVNHRPDVAAAGDGRLWMQSRPNRSGSAVVEAKFSSVENSSSARAVQQAPPCEVVVVFLESGPNNSAVQAVWRIQMWHITVLRTSNNPVAQAAPQKVI